MVLVEVIFRAALFGWFVLASYRHFVVPHPEPIGMKLVRVVSLVAWASNSYITVSPRNSALFPFSDWLSLGLVLLSAGIFASALKASTNSGIQIAFSTIKANRLLRTGIYSIIRHPFYAAYLLFWWSWCLTSTSLIPLLFAVVLTVLYCTAMRTEDSSLAQSHGGDFEHYKSVTPSLVPTIAKKAVKKP